MEQLRAHIDASLEHRTAANARFFHADAERLARLCHRMAERFARGGRLVAVGLSPAARSDVRHIAVEFVHPVIVGKRALPAIGLTRDAGPLRLQVELVAERDDIVIAFTSSVDADASEVAEVADAIAEARRRGCLTVAFAPMGAEWEFAPPTHDPFVRQELIETLYHTLWELVHVFFDHRGLLDGREAPTRPDVGASSFLYPFLATARPTEDSIESVVDDVRRSVLMKAEEVGELRLRTVGDARATLAAAAQALRALFDGGGSLLAFGNGGSATDAMDLVADFRTPYGDGPSRRALDLTEDPAILTAIANDIGTDAIFSRQIIAYGRAGDAALALSTSGNSRNVIQALGEARRRGLVTIALVGYDGGRVLAEQLADHVIVTPSQHIPRIQEAQASAYHILRELVEQVTLA
ncbi:MAG TPA: SIS domain-containing protein [Gemmatimonadaceae bacterium]|nr:SIS domain-containing protein [Gemmatimonadaceae bacterium]